MKILHVIPFFSPSLGGSVTVPYYLSYWLGQNGHDVTIITTDYLFDPDYSDSLEKIKVFHFQCSLSGIVHLLS